MYTQVDGKGMYTVTNNIISVKGDSSFGMAFEYLYEEAILSVSSNMVRVEGVNAVATRVLEAYDQVSRGLVDF